MARWREPADPVPPELAGYADADWPGEGGPAAWGEAARRWLADNPDRGLPWNPDGDPVAVRVAVVMLRKLHLGGGPLVLGAQDLAWLVAQRYNDVPLGWRPSGHGWRPRPVLAGTVDRSGGNNGSATR